MKLEVKTLSPIPGAKIASVEAILFDLDGTLLTTDRQVTERLTGRLRFLGANYSQNLARWLLMKAEHLGSPLVATLDLLGLEKTFMPLLDKLREWCGVYPANRFTLLPGIKEMICKLSNRYHLGIVTTRSRYHVDCFLERFPDIAACFDTTCSLQDTRRFKPHPLHIQTAAQMLKVSPQHCLMVGDTTMDVRAARFAGAWSVAVLCGIGRRPELEKAGAHLILEKTTDLNDYLHIPI
ncbi:MAG: HAD family hydrolase [bacterium]|nr:HAD family hydrolase [bacterium]